MQRFDARIVWKPGGVLRDDDGGTPFVFGYHCFEPLTFTEIEVSVVCPRESSARATMVCMP